MRKKAFTLVEVMVAVIIIGILAAMGLPYFPKTIESTQARHARVALEQIRAGERIYRLNTGSYFPGAGNTNDDEFNLNQFLGIALDTREVDWRYQVDTPTNDTFTATAERTGGTRNVGETITIDETGALGGNFSP